MSHETRAAAARLSLFAGALVLVCMACSGGGTPAVDGGATVEAPSATGYRPTPAPPFTSVDSVSSSEVLAYAATLEFVDEVARVDTHTYIEGDRRALIRLSPEIGSRRITLSDLKQGRITARWTRYPDSVRYPMATMVGYIWTDSIPAGWRVIYFPSDPRLARVVRRATVKDTADASADSYPMPRSRLMADTTQCHWTDQRWECPSPDELIKD